MKCKEDIDIKDEDKYYFMDKDMKFTKLFTMSLDFKLKLSQPEMWFIIMTESFISYTDNALRKGGSVNGKILKTSDLARLMKSKQPNLRKIIRNLKELNILDEFVLPGTTGKAIVYNPFIITKGNRMLKFVADHFKNESEQNPFDKKKKSRKAPGYIYVMNCLNYYKIGISKDCKRLGEYTKLPDEPIYYLIEYVDNMIELEKTLHTEFDSVRLRDGGCEWFNLSSTDLERLVELVKPHVIKRRMHTDWYYKYSGDITNKLA